MQKDLAWFYSLLKQTATKLSKRSVREKLFCSQC